MITGVLCHGSKRNGLCSEVKRSNASNRLGGIRTKKDRLGLKIKKKLVT